MSEIYSQNFLLLQKRFPELAEKIKQLNSFKWKLEKVGLSKKEDLFSEEGRLIDEDNIEGSFRYFLSQLPLDTRSSLVVFGYGLGYLYPLIKSWLHHEPWKKIVFLENDLEVIHHSLFLSETADLLKDHQIEIYLLPKDEKEIEMFFRFLTSKIAFRNSEFVFLPAYMKKDPSECMVLKYYFDFLSYRNEGSLTTHFDSSLDFFKNYWNNLKYLPNAYLFSDLKDRLKGIPAIICGAGPSLRKNASELKKLSDKALIFAGGTAVNVLNAYGITPHLTLGLDPFESYYTRTLSYTCFETPFLFKPRIYKKILESMTQPLIYFPGCGNYDIENELEKQVGIPVIDINLGTNVANASASLAQYMGCSPIIIIGVDLAYSDGESYGATLAKTAFAPKGYATKLSSEQIVMRKDIYGKPVKTLSKWINEASWYTQFKKTFPETPVLNATEGGIGFPEVDNVTLANIGKSLNERYDIEGLLHTELEQVSKVASYDPNFSVNILKGLKEFTRWLNDLERKRPELFKTSSIFNDNEVLDWIEKHKDESFWKDLLHEFSETYINFLKTIYPEGIEEHPFVKEYKGYLLYMKRIALINIHYIEESLKDYFPRIALDQKIDKETESIDFSGIKKTSTEPKNSYALSGQLLTSTYYKDHLREGSSVWYYHSGKVFAILNYAAGVLEGEQKYYHENGSLKSNLFYSKGVLNGKVEIYWPDQSPARKADFKDGKRDGKELVWNEAHQLIFSAEYKDNKPVGVAKAWHPTQTLHLEIVYDDDSRVVYMREFNAEGVELQPQNEVPGYLEGVSQNSDTLSESLVNLSKSLDASAKIMLDKNIVQDSSLEDDFKKLNLELENLSKLSSDLKEISKPTDNTMSDELWKSKELEDYLNNELKKLTKTLSNNVNQMTFNVRDIRKNLKDKDSGS